MVIPVFNAVETLPSQLEAIAAQTYSGDWEVIVADNGSSDGTPDAAEAWIDKLPALLVVSAGERRGASHARNVGVAAARGDFLVFCDADDVATPSWLEAIVNAAEEGDVIRGSLDRESLNGRVPARTGLPEHDRPMPVYGFLPFASSANMGIWREVLDAVGGWDETYPIGHDTELSWRAQLSGYTFRVAPRAVMRKRERRELRAVARQSYDYALDVARLYRDFRTQGMQRGSLADTLWDWAKVALGLPYLLFGPYRRRAWLRLAAYRSGRIVGCIRYRVVFP